MFSQRSGRSRAPNALAQALAQLAQPPRLDLCGSNPTRAGMSLGSAVLDALGRAASPASVYAPEPFGITTAREAVARHFATTRAVAAPAREDVLLTASTSEAYSFLFKLLCDPGDQVLIPAPSYPLFEHLAELEAVEVVPYRLDYDGAWHVDLDSVRRARSARTRAIIVVSPNNPSGQYIGGAELRALDAHGLPLLCDEVFYEYPLRPRPPVDVAEAQSLRFSMGGLSKLVGAPQLKLAWTVMSGPEAARREARERLELIADTFLSVATPVQLALPEILQVAPDVTDGIRARCAANLERLGAVTAGSALTLLRAEGGWSAVLRLPDVLGEDELVIGLLRQHGVLVQPGWFYDFEREPYVVLSLLTEPSTFREGGERLVEYVTRVAG